MMSRQVTMFVEAKALPAVLAALVDEVVPAYCPMPQFLGFTVLQSDAGLRPEVVATSYWHDGLEESAELSDRFVGRIRAIEGVTAAKRTFDLLFATMRDTEGGFCVEGHRSEAPRAARAANGADDHAGD